VVIKRKKSTSRPRRAATSAMKPRDPKPTDAADAADHPIDVAVDRFFKNDARVREAVSRNLKERGAATLEVAGRAKAAFASFAPTKYSTEERERRNFVPADADAAPAVRAVLDKGIEAMRASVPRRALKIQVGGALEQMIEPSGGAGARRVALGEFLQYVTLRIDGPLNAASGSAITECRAEREAQRRLDDVLGEDGDADPALDPASPAVTTPAATEMTPDAFVNAHVQTQMNTATSPEERLRFAVPSRSDPKQTDKAIETFELRAGPADVTSYHDFNNLQIAFDHVWTEIFDGRLSKLGQELYHEYVKLQEFIGVAPEDRSIDTLDDLKRLMDEIRELSRITTEATPAQLQPPGEPAGSTPSANTTDTVVDVVTTVLDPASVITDAIGDETIAAILNPAGAIINAIGDLIKGLPQIRWSSFSGPLPGGGRISATIEANAVPAGEVEIVLLTGPNTRGWKGIKFTELDANKRPKNPYWIANDPNDVGVWSRNSYNRLPLYTPQMASSYLEFWHEGIFSIHAACYVMDALSEKLTDRTRVTFNWTKD